jgi:LacI family transcriptional regulator
MSGKKEPLGTSRQATAGAQPTLKTIATKLGLGVTTVSRALKDAPEIGLKTRQLVQAAAREAGYRPNRAGVRLRTGKTNVISLVLDTQEQVGSFVSEMIFGVTEALAGTSYHLIVTPYSHLKNAMDPIRYLVETGSCDGVIISRIEPDDERVKYMLENNMPFATHGRTYMGAQHPYHDFDNHAYGELAVDALAKVGRTRLALLAPPSDLSFHNHMRDGFLVGLAKHGFSEVPFDVVNNDDSIEDIRRAVRTMMNGPSRPDGIVSGSGGASGTGGSTYALVMGIEDVGLKLGVDVDIVGKQLFTGSPLIREDLMVITEEVRAAGRELGKAVLGAIDGKPVAELQSMMVPTEVERPSVVYEPKFQT